MPTTRYVRQEVLIARIEGLPNGCTDQHRKKRMCVWMYLCVGEAGRKQARETYAAIVTTDDSYVSFVIQWGCRRHGSGALAGRSSQKEVPRIVQRRVRQRPAGSGRVYPNSRPGQGGRSLRFCGGRSWRRPYPRRRGWGNQPFLRENTSTEGLTSLSRIRQEERVVLKGLA
jgi:hypothetical protein